jgi:hypothetical protein
LQRRWATGQGRERRTNLSNANHESLDYSKAIEYHGQCLAIAKEVGDRAGEGKANGIYGNLVNAYHETLGNLSKAIEYHRQRLAIAKEVGDRAGEGSIRQSLQEPRKWVSPSPFKSGQLARALLPPLTKRPGPHSQSLVGIDSSY